MERRTFLGAAMLSLIGTGAAAAQALTPPARPDDEAAWQGVANAYPARPDIGIINLEFGAFGQMPKVVQAAFETYVRRVNAEGAYFTRRNFAPYYQGLRQRVAAMLNADPLEIALTRNATESLLALIGGYGRLKTGDAVLMSDHDYDSMQTGMAWLKSWRGVDVLTINLPQPATYQTLIDAYDQALKANPKVRLMLLTHICHRNGLRLPVKEIIAMARTRGVDVIVDSAHAWGQGSVDVRAEGFDFAGFNLHKWLGAPLGVGAVYIHKDRIADIEPYMGQEESAKDLISSRVHTGTANFAAQMAACEALDFHKTLGSDMCGARFKYLRDLWVKPARELGTIEILTPDDPRLCAGITSFRLKGQTMPEANAVLAKRLLDEAKVFTVMRTGLASGACVRVTPGYSTTPQDMTAFSAVLKRL
jgi:selenocysteine lyase/cysteine desulfurase